MTTTVDWQHILNRRSFLEYDARARAEALLDPGSMRVLCGPFDRLESPWLEPQGIVPQSDDGVVIVAAPSTATRWWWPRWNRLSRAAASARFPAPRSAKPCGWRPQTAGRQPTAGVLLLETGGVRLQEANLGLNASRRSVPP